MEDMGNPFTEDSGDLLVLDTRDVADQAVIETVRTIEKTGQEHYDKYVHDSVNHTTNNACV